MLKYELPKKIYWTHSYLFVYLIFLQEADWNMFSILIEKQDKK